MIQEHDALCPKFVAWANGTGPAPSKIFAIIGLTDGEYSVQVLKDKPKFIPGSGLIPLCFRSPTSVAFELECHIKVVEDHTLVKLLTDGDVPEHRSDKISDRPQGDFFTYGEGPNVDGRWRFEFADASERNGYGEIQSPLLSPNVPHSTLVCVEGATDEEEWDITIRFEWASVSTPFPKPPPMRTLK